MTTTLDNIQRPAVGARRVRLIGEADLNWALAQGWRDFGQNRGDILVLALLYPLIGFAAAALCFDSDLAPLFFPLVSGLTILGPAVASGFYEIARRRDAGLEASWTHFLDPLRRPGRAGLAVLTVGLTLLFITWLCVAWLIASATIGLTPGMSAAEFLRRVLDTPRGWTLIALGNLAGLGFAAATLVFSLISFPMVVDGGADPVSAVLTSVHAVRANPRATVSWGLRVAGLLVLGCLPAFMGLAIVLPVLGYATWRLYTRLVVR